MNRCYLFLCCLTISAMSVGCCGPIGCGTAGSCGDCDGGCYGQRVIPSGPIDSLRQMRRNLVCGSGCGEVYRGEWISTPPDCQDPCCGTEFVGGAAPCRPFCWQPGMLLGHLYGSRFCDSGISLSSCGCGLASCDGDCGCDGGDEMLMEVGEGEVSLMGSAGGSDCGCGASHTVSRPMTVTQRSLPASDSMTRSAQLKSRSQRVIR